MPDNRLSQRFKSDRASITDPNDPNAVPAFETSAGIDKMPHATNQQPVYVNAQALENFNRNVSPEVLKHQLEAANVASLFAKRAIRPDEIAALRRRMFDVVNKGLGDVEEVLAGTKQWNNVQVRLFSILTERVMPKLTSITVDDPSSKKLEDLTMEELEAIALGKSKAEAVDAIVKQGTAMEHLAEKQEQTDLEKAQESKKLVKMASLAEAEKVYVEKKTGVADKGKPKKPRTGSTSTPRSRKPT